ncbi:hypothetical protein [Bryobacter aggregatus]|uniref:hypothetical protein n=1 Tax=Bryobacter aggregatus TaxID=360054 RepID=UPI0004E1186F|nr:hypothetical protein [Bryobacter aggregatus]
MNHEPDPKDPRTVWQSQPTEDFATKSADMQRKARQFEAKMRRDRLGNLGIGIAIILFCGWRLAFTENLIARSGFGLAIAWTLFGIAPGAWRTKAARMAGDAATDSGLAFYRSALKERINWLRQPWRWLHGPLFLAIAAVVYPVLQKANQTPGVGLKMLPFFSLLGIWTLASVTLQVKEMRSCQRELAQLKNL